MEYGSVKFWRHVIVGFVVGLILLFLLLFVIFFVRSNILQGTVRNQAKEIQSLSAKVIEANASDPVNTRVDGLEADASAPDAPAPDQSEDDAEPMGYQLLYPDMMMENADKTDDNSKKIVYLTFDDGPSEENTEKILNILDEYGVKATFFVSGQFGDKEFRSEMYRREMEAGHTVALHTFSHDYTGIYDSVDAYFKDLNKIYTEVYEATGVQPNLIRFPGGSLNSYNGGIYQQLIAEVTRRGFTYHDWLVSSEDAAHESWSASQEMEAIRNGCENRTKIVLLCHDTDSQDCTVNALPDMLDYLLEEGYEFRALDNTIRPFHFSYMN